MFDYYHRIIHRSFPGDEISFGPENFQAVGKHQFIQLQTPPHTASFRFRGKSVGG